MKDLLYAKIEVNWMMMIEIIKGGERGEIKGVEGEVLFLMDLLVLDEPS